MCSIFAIYKYDPFSSCVKLDPVALGELQARGPEGGGQHYFPDSSGAEIDYWNKIYGRFKSGQLETWDYP